MSEEEVFDFSLMSWNILAPCWVNKDWYPCLYELAVDYQTRFEIIFSKIRLINCDIIFLQEAQKDFIDLYKEKLNGNYIMEFAPNNPTSASASNGLLTLINKNWKYSNEVKILNDILDFERGEAIQIISIVSKNLHFINIHLDYYHHSSQENQIHKRFYELLDYSSSISIIAGDFNTIKQYHWNEYKNIFNESNDKNIIPTYYPDSSDLTLRTPVDHIFYNPNQIRLIDCEKAWDRSDRTSEETLKTFGSDHIYIWAKFQFL